MNSQPDEDPPSLGLKILRVLAALLVVAVIIFGIGLELSAQLP
jgi:hypothetical protein